MTSNLSAKEIKEKYLEYLNLNYVKSLQDPDEEPYKSKYEARKILEALLPEIEKVNFDDSQFIESNENNCSELKRSYDEWISKLASVSGKDPRTFLMLKFLEYNLSRNFVETEEIERGEKILSRITQEIDHFDSSASGFEYNPLTIALELSCLNELIFVWSGRGDYKRCLSLIETVEEIYRAYKTATTKTESIVPFDTLELIELDCSMSREKRCANFESLYTHSLFYFAQVYGKLDEKEKSANYCQATLQRQMDEHLRKKTAINEETTTTSQNDVPQPQERVVFNPLDWATHAAAISQYYQCQCDFPTARHCLCCAQAILDKLNAEKSGTSELLKEQTASIKRCWGKYAIEIMKTAKRKLIDDSIDSSSLAAEIDKVSRFRFQLPESEYKLSECEKTALTSNLPLDYDQARVIFLKAQQILNETKEFFKLDGYVTDHCEILRDLSDLYAGLIFFECDLSRKCKMHKRRLDLLEPVCNEINEQFYLTLKRQLLFDCGSILSEMIDLKIDIFKEDIESKKVSRERTEEMRNKINQMIENSLKYFDQFLTTMKIQPERVRLPEKFDDVNIRPALLAKFYIGRLHSKFIVVDPAKKLDHMKQTLDNYSYLVDYCDRNKEDTGHMVNEYNVCKEMVFLLPKEMEIVRMNII